MEKKVKMNKVMLYLAFFLFRVKFKEEKEDKEGDLSESAPMEIFPPPPPQPL